MAKMKIKNRRGSWGGRGKPAPPSFQNFLLGKDSQAEVQRQEEGGGDEWTKESQKIFWEK